jgi:hypothetical protein
MENRSVEQPFQQSKEILLLLKFVVLGEDYSSILAFNFPAFKIPKKTTTIRVINDFRTLSLLLKHRISPISYSKYWVIDIISSM